MCIVFNVRVVSVGIFNIKKLGPIELFLSFFLSFFLTFTSLTIRIHWIIARRRREAFTITYIGKKNNGRTSMASDQSQSTSRLS